MNAGITGEIPHIDGGQSSALRSLPAISGKATKETVIPSVLTSDQAVCSPAIRCQTRC